MTDATDELVAHYRAIVAETKCERMYWPVADIAALLSRLDAAEARADKAEKALRTVQNAAKTIAACQGTELEHLRQNATFDHRLRSQHESLLERDAQMTDALLAAEAEAVRLAAELAEARKIVEPFAKHIDRMKFDIDYHGNPLPDDQAVGWIYVTNGDFRAARAWRERNG
jgi:chromosome segregation ATPase